MYQLYDGLFIQKYVIVEVIIDLISVNLPQYEFRSPSDRQREGLPIRV